MKLVRRQTVETVVVSCPETDNVEEELRCNLCVFSRGITTCGKIKCTYPEGGKWIPQGEDKCYGESEETR